MTDAAYDDAHYTRAFPDGYAAHFWHRARLGIVRAELDALGARSVIDVGCGPGQYVRALRDAGYDCVGCDPGAVKARADLRPYVFGRTELEALDAARLAEAEAVLLLDVLEHLPDPLSMLTRVRRRMPALKGVIVTVPARSELWSELDRRAGHRRRYDLAGIEALIVDAGFEVTESTYLFRLLYPAARLATRSRRSRVVTAPSWPILHDALARVLIADRTLLPRRLRGTSALCVGRPRATDEAGA